MTAAAPQTVALEAGHHRRRLQTAGLAVARLAIPPGVGGVRHGGGVVDASIDNGLVGIAFEEFHDHLLPDARNGHAPKPLPCPRVGGADPAGGVLVRLAVAVPVEFHLHASEVVHVDFLAFGAHDDGGLRALHDRLGGDARQPELLLRINGLKGAMDGEFAGLAGFVLAVGKGVVAGGDEPGTVLVLSRMAFQLELAADLDAAGVGGGIDDLVLGLKFLDAEPGVGFAFGLFLVFARVVEDFPFGTEALGGCGGLGLEGGTGFFKVEIGEGVDAGLELLPDVPAGDVLATGVARLLGAERNFLVTFGRDVAGEVIDEDNLMLVGAVPPEVVDAFLFHEAADEVEVRLPVLHAVNPGLVTGLEMIDDIGESVFLEHGLDDVRDGLVLEDTAIRGAGEEPDPRHNDGPVAGVNAEGISEGKRGHNTMEMPDLSARELDGNGDGFAHELVELNVGILAQQIGFNSERAAKLFGESELAENQFVLAQRGANGHHAFARAADVGMIQSGAGGLTSISLSGSLSHS